MAKQELVHACVLRRVQVASWLAVGLASLSPSLAWGATHAYPGAAPCNGTLQACINGVNAGERIEITTSAPIAESLSIAKSLTLAAAPGSTPHLGGELSPRDLHPLQVTVNEAPGGAVTNVTFSQLSFDADITVHFASGAGHSFVFDRSAIERHSVDVPAEEAEFPGTTPLDFTDNALLSITSSVPANVRITGSTFIASAGNVELHALGAAGAAIGFDVVRNRFIGAECCGGEFASTVLVDLQGGAVTANVSGNLMHRRAGGSTTLHVGVFQSNMNTAFSGNVYVTSNTFDDAAEPGNSLENSSDIPPGARNEGSVAGIFAQVERSDFLHIYDNLFSYLENDFYNDPSGIADVKNNDFFGIKTPQWQALPQASAQLSVDPHYASYALDFHLQSGSPLIDAGSSAAPAGLQATDLDGNPRIAGGNVDIGAYEYTPPPPPNEGGEGGETATAGASNAAGEAGTPATAHGGGPSTTGGAGGTSAGRSGSGGRSGGHAGGSARGGAGAGTGAGGAGVASAGMGTAGKGAGPSSSGGCAVQGGGSAEPGVFLLGLAAALLGRRRRRLRGARATNRSER